jgi:hypothetical protein
MSRSVSVLGVLVALALALLPRAEAGPEDDEGALRGAGLATDGPGLLEFFRKRTLGDTDRARIEALVRRLGDDDFEVREKASEDLVAVGPAARARLREATRDPDLEVRWRAKECLVHIERGADPAVLATAVRVLAQRKPAGATGVLLAFLPNVEDAEVGDEVVKGLAVVGVPSGKPEPALVEALGDRLPVKRAAAAEALCRAGGTAQRPAVRKLLRDPDALVRQRVALSLLFEARDRDAVPVLIDLTAELPRERVTPVEDALYQLAGDRPPEEPSGTDEPARRREVWAGWWKEHGSRIDLASLEDSRRLRGYTLIVELDVRGTTNGRVFEVDSAGKVRWQIEGLRYPIDAQVIGNGRVLVCEYAQRTVTERDLKGEVLWRHQVPSILLGARRLRNGNTFIVTRNQLLEVDRAGKEVFSITRPNDIRAACRLPDGGAVLATTQGECVRVDAAGRPVKSFPVGLVSTLGSNIEALPGGRVLVPLYSQNRVVEFDADGRVAWQAAVARPTCVTRLPNGHTLVGSRTSTRIVELDQAGKEVWGHTHTGRVVRASRR